MHACSCQRGGAAAAPRVAGGRLPSAAGSSSKKAPSCVRPCACCRAPRDTQHTRHLVLGELRWLSFRWAEALLKIARMTLTIKRDGNWSSFQLANSALPLSVTSSAIAPSARMRARLAGFSEDALENDRGCSIARWLHSRDAKNGGLRRGLSVQCSAQPAEADMGARSNP